MESVEKVYPTVEELNKVQKNRPCPECSALFLSESHLNLHLAKTHKKSEFLQSSSVQRIFHCPIPTCSYNSTAHFKQMKLLKQHFLKVHSERNHICGFCKKGFSTESACNRHSEYCNITFKCCECDTGYPCYETLKTHGRRKKHKILEKIAYKSSGLTVDLKGHKSEENVSSNKIRLLLPKTSNSTGVIIISDTSERSCQTEKLNQSQETQTLLAYRMPYFTVETQTIGDYSTKKTETTSGSLKTTKTQTVAADPKTASCNTLMALEEFNLNMIHEVQRNSSGTQTTLLKDSEPNSPSTTTHGSIHTDTSDLLMDTLDTNFFNMETQTDFNFNDELFKYCDDYANMYTQTCEDLLLGEIALNNTHTQTVFDDMLKSVESQTDMSQAKMVSLSCKDNVTHMETQTDALFKQMLEEINASL